MLEKMTLAALWANSQNTYADAPALSTCKKDSFSYAEAGALSRGVQRWLAAHGIEKGDKVALLAENSPWWGISYMAITTMGAAVVPIMIDFSSEQVQNILDHSESKALIASPRGMVAAASHTLLAGQSLVIRHGIFEWIGAPGISGESRTQDDIIAQLGTQIEGVSHAELPKHIQEIAIEEEDTAAIIYTSGTTGQSKGVMLSHKNLVHNAKWGIVVGRMTAGERVRMLSLLPLAHAYECTIGFILPMLVGSEVVYLSGPPSPRLLLPALKETKPHYVLAVPLLIEKIYKNTILAKIKEKKLIAMLYKTTIGRKLLNRFVLGKALMETFGGRVRFFGIGGAPLDPEVELFLKEAHFPLAMGYGLTETSPCIAGYTPFTGVFHSTGYVYDDVEVRIADPNEKGEGEIQVKGPNVMQGYFKAPELSAEAFTEDGWFKTGDLGIYDPKNRALTIRGRLKNVIISAAGENIYPEEIEAVINRNPYVDDALVLSEGASLVASIRFNIEKFREYVGEHATAELIAEKKAELLKSIRDFANSSLHAHSKLSKVDEEPEPFEKTPSHKIKRYLYTMKKAAQKKDSE